MGQEAQRACGLENVLLHESSVESYACRVGVSTREHVEIADEAQKKELQKPLGGRHRQVCLPIPTHGKHPRWWPPREHLCVLPMGRVQGDLSGVRVQGGFL
jgi:hypothetical protein